MEKCIENILAFANITIVFLRIMKESTGAQSKQSTDRSGKYPKDNLSSYESSDLLFGEIESWWL